jgi:hypothetical protein
MQRNFGNILSKHILIDGRTQNRHRSMGKNRPKVSVAESSQTTKCNVDGQVSR